ncbi:ras-related protein Rab-2B-like [Clytia hemisphaerica]|uniref:ras-related protein Rab-2B-like n=1 Tax=Clytia hemisphaerica TaxID=252671 RepID=UPI0034D5639E
MSINIKIRSCYDDLTEKPTSNTKKLPIYKCVLLGDSKSGKTKFFYRFKTKRFIEDDDRTMKPLHPNEIQYCSRDFSIGDFEGRIQLWDTLGIENSASLSKQYLRQSKGVLLIYDTTNDHSGEGLKKWYRTATEHIEKGECLYFVIGTKTDREGDKSVSLQAMKDRLEYANITEYFEVSTRTGDEFDESLGRIIERVLMKLEGVLEDESQNPSGRGEETKRKCC